MNCQDKRFTDVRCIEEGIIFYDNDVYRSFNEEGFEEWLNKEVKLPWLMEAVDF